MYYSSYSLSLSLCVSLSIFLSLGRGHGEVILNTRINILYLHYLSHFLIFQILLKYFQYPFNIEGGPSGARSRWLSRDLPWLQSNASHQAHLLQLTHHETTCDQTNYASCYLTDVVLLSPENGMVHMYVDRVRYTGSSSLCGPPAALTPLPPDRAI
jgi:hypothetical protein